MPSDSSGEYMLGVDDEYGNVRPLSLDPDSGEPLLKAFDSIEDARQGIPEHYPDDVEVDVYRVTGEIEADDPNTWPEKMRPKDGEDAPASMQEAAQDAGLTVFGDEDGRYLLVEFEETVRRT